MAAMRALLARYSANGQYIVTTYEALPSEFDLGNGRTMKVSHSKGFDDFFDDGAPENVVDYMSTAVHEVYHAYAGTMAYQLAVDGKVEVGDGVEALYVGGEPLLIAYSASYPAREMDSTFPADARTMRYATYVTESDALQSTQQYGAYGFIDEWAAYYNDARTIVDLWPGVRDESPSSERLAVNYVARFHEMWVP